MSARWKSSFARGGIARLDEGADVGIARGDHAVERREDFLEALQLLQPADIGFTGIDQRALGREIARGLIALLVGDGVAS